MFRSIDEAGGASKTSAINQNNESIQKRLLSKKELAIVLGVSQRTVENWCAQKKIPRARLILLHFSRNASSNFTKYISE